MAYLESLRVFVRVVELGSITAGGRDMRLTPAVASNRIKYLENRFGVRLLNRTTRRLTPTEIGRAFYEHARKVIDSLDDAEAAIDSFSGAPHGTIRLTAPLGVGRDLIAPLIPTFCEENPGVEFQLRLSDRLVNIVEDGIDMAFFLGQPQDSTLKWRQIAECPRVLAASPDYLAAHGTPNAPEALSEHNCLLLRFPRSPEYFWQLACPDGTRKMMVSGRYDADDGEVLIRWALSGKGIVNRPRFELAEHLAAGRLVEVLPGMPPLPAQFGCLTPHRKLQDPKVQIFSEYAIRALKGRFQAQAVAQT